MSSHGVWADNAAAMRALWERLALPEVRLRDGGRDYVDWLTDKEVGPPAVRGWDGAGRRLIAFRILSQYEDEEPEPLTLSAHERYTDRQDVWVIAGGDSRTDGLLGHPRPDPVAIERLLRGERLVGQDAGLRITLWLASRADLDGASAQEGA